MCLHYTIFLVYFKTRLSKSDKFFYSESETKFQIVQSTELNGLTRDIFGKFIRYKSGQKT